MIFALMLAAYTNHAGLAVAGVPVRLEARHVTLSNGTETVRVPLSIFPQPELRRLAADCGSTRFVPEAVRRAVEGQDARLARAYARLSKDLITKDDYEAFRAKAADARKAYFDKAVETGLVTEKERRLLEN